MIQITGETAFSVQSDPRSMTSHRQQIPIFILLALSQTSPGFYVPAVYKFFENTVGKGEIARNLLGSFLSFSSNKKLSSANSFSLEESKICRLEKG